MELKCPGCGAVIQSDDPSKSGYINKNVLEKRKDDFLCERCFKLKHYNEVKTVETKNIDFDSVFSKILTEKSLIVNIIDSFDLLGSIITNINELFPNSLVLIIANKFDLFLRSNRPTKLRTYLKAYLKEKNIEFCDLLVTSSLDSASAKPIYETIKKYSRNRNVYFVGMANVGKSTLLNTISKEYGDKIDLTTSIQVGTTLDISKFKIGDLVFGDTPGYYNPKQATYYLEKKSLNLTIPKKYIKPRIYQLYPNDTIFINGFGYVTLKSEEKTAICFYVANTLMLYRTKNNPDEYYNKHLTDLLTVPNKNEINKLGGMKKTNLEIDCELAISGIGFLAFSKKCSIELSLFENIAIEKRKKLI